MSFDRPRARTADAAGRRGGAVLLFAAVWAVGLLALVGVLSLYDRADDQHHGQVLVERLGNRVGALPAIGFSPQTGQDVSVSAARKRMRGANRPVNRLLHDVVEYGSARSQRELTAAVRRFQKLNQQLIPLAAGGRADELFGRASRRGGAVAELDSELAGLSARYARETERAEGLANAGTVVTMLLLLLASSMAMAGVLRSGRRAKALAADNARLHEQSLRDSLTDSLTGLPNRRAVFDRFGGDRLAEAGPCDVAILDLDGFKLFNDTFGHPAGDVLLHRMGARLQEALGDEGTAYRLGGDEFCVISAEPGGDVMPRAQAAMSERGKGFSVRCSIGVTTTPTQASTLEQALRVADKNLYADKYAHRLTRRTRAPA